MAMSTFLESMRARAIDLPIAVIGNVLILEHGYTIASQAVGDYTTALQVAGKPCLGHSTVSGGDEGCVTLESKRPTDTINREQQMLAILEIERPANDRFGARHVAEGWLQSDAILLALRCLQFPLLLLRQ